jgi:D-alanyl-D-alanine carboxypeptidase (penicillin-binding protein 5/6)
VNENQQLPLASLTKLMTALLAVETFDLKSNIAIAPEALAIEGDSGLFANETWKVGDLVSFMMLSSSNNGAGALAAAAGSLWEPSVQVADTTSVHSKVNIFVDKMNIRAKELGLEDTMYTNPTGLDGQTTGGLGTASDMAHLMTYIWQKEHEAIYQTNILQKDFVSEDNFSHKAENTNGFVNTVSGIMGSKTGYTDLAGGNLAIIYDAGMDNPIVIVVLGSSPSGRFNDMSLLVDATSEYVESGWYEYEKMAGSTSQLKKNS